MRGLRSCCRSRQHQVRNTMADSTRQTSSTLRGTTNTNVQLENGQFTVTPARNTGCSYTDTGAAPVRNAK
jgi:hypothetical protein